MIHRSVTAAAAVILWSGGVFAQEGRPLNIEDVSEAAEIRVSLPAAVTGHPELHDEMLGRGRMIADRFKLEAEQAMAEAANDPDYPWNPWSLDYIYEPRYLGPVYASFLVNIISYEGGAHPSLNYETVTRDLELNAPVTLFDLFIDAEEGSETLVVISEFVTAELARQKEERTGAPVDLAEAEWLDAVAPRPGNFELFTLEPAREQGLVAGLSFHYAPYVAGPYVEGPYDVFVPASVLAPHLAGYFPAIFGGEPVVAARLSSYEDPGVFVFLETPDPETASVSPLAVAGEAPAQWFEAGEVAARVEDLDGNVLGQATVTAEPDMPASNITIGMMRFSASVPFEAGEVTEGQLVISPPEGAGSEVTAFLRF